MLDASSIITDIDSFTAFSSLYLIIPEISMVRVSTPFHRRKSGMLITLWFIINCNTDSNFRDFTEKKSIHFIPYDMKAFQFSVNVLAWLCKHLCGSYFNWFTVWCSHLPGQLLSVLPPCSLVILLLCGRPIPFWLWENTQRDSTSQLVILLCFLHGYLP